MSTVVSEIPLPDSGLPVGVTLVRGGRARIRRLEGDSSLVAIVCSRALARTVVGLEIPGLRLVQLTSAGYDGVPLDEYSKRGVMVANAGDVYTTPIAEMVMYGILQMAKRYRRNPNRHSARLLRNYHHIVELSGKRAVIIGTGRIGTAVAKRLSAFDVHVTGYNPRTDPGPEFDEVVYTQSALYSALANAEYVVCALPGDDSTRGFVDANLLDHLSPAAVLVNVGRRETIREEDLYRVLRSKAIGGAVLDMFEVMPNPLTNRFRRLGNVIVLPAVAAVSREVSARLGSLAAQNITAVLDGRTPENLVRRG